MNTSRLRYVVLSTTLISCQPLNDLDAATSGGVAAAASSGAQTITANASASAPIASDASAQVSAPPSATPQPSSDPTPTTMSGEPATSAADSSAPATASAPLATTSQAPDPSAMASSSADASASVMATGAGSTSAAPSAASTAPGIGLPPGEDAPELPIDLPMNPVEGDFTISVEAEWEVDGVFVPTFEIHTPSASYWVPKPLGMIVSLSEPTKPEALNWLNYSSGFRPLRTLPSLGTFEDPLPAMTTTLDEESRTTTHVRLNAESAQWRIIYDFYPTHVTITVNQAPTPYGMAFRGVIGNGLETADRFVLANGTDQGAKISLLADLQGPAEWAYLADAGGTSSFFMIQHADDELTDRFQVMDTDSPMLSFGDGELTRLPLRFSFGLIASTQYPVVHERVDFIVSAIH